MVGCLSPAAELWRAAYAHFAWERSTGPARPPYTEAQRAVALAERLSPQLEW